MFRSTLFFFSLLFSLTTLSQTVDELDKEFQALFKNGKFEEALAVGIRLKNIAKDSIGEDNLQFATILRNLAEAYEELGQLPKIEPLYIQDAGIRKKFLGPEHPDYIFSVYSLATLYHRLTQYARAEPLFLEVKKYREKTFGTSSSEYAYIIESLGGLYVDMGQYDKAEPLLTESGEIVKKLSGDTSADYAISLNNLGSFYELTRQYAKAEPLLIQALEIRRRIRGVTHPEYAASLNNLANVYVAQKKFASAEPLYVESLNIRKKAYGETHPRVSAGLNNLASLYQDMGEYNKAIELYIQAREISKKTFGEDHLDYGRNTVNLGTAYLSAGDYKKAEPLLLWANDQSVKRMKNTFTVLSENEKKNYIDRNSGGFHILNSILFDQQYKSPELHRKAFNYLLFLKSLALFDTKKILDYFRNTKDSSLKKIFDKWQSNKAAIAKQYSLPLNRRDSNFAVTEMETENLEKQLSRVSAVFRTQKEGLDISFEDVRNNLNDDEAAIEYIRFRYYNKGFTEKNYYAAYVVRKQDSFPVFIPLFDEKELLSVIGNTQKTSGSLAAILYRGIKKQDNGNANPGRALYKLVWEPLEPSLKNIHKISYSPDGNLYSLAFHALPIDSVSVLMDRYQLSQYTSTRQLALRQSKHLRSKPAGIVLFGDPNFTHPPSKNSTSGKASQNDRKAGPWAALPGTAKEIISIQALFKKSKLPAVSYSREEATEERFKSLSGNAPNVLHLATHGFFVTSDSTLNVAPSANSLLRSGIILAGGNNAWMGDSTAEKAEDGIVTAYEISQLDLSNTQLVVLSACETALGDIKGSEGVFGLQRAFKLAGVRQMIVSLWQVPDNETAELMKSFYTYWLAGKIVREAFHLAQTGLRKKYLPFYWAAFTLIE